MNIDFSQLVRKATGLLRFLPALLAGAALLVLASCPNPAAGVPNSNDLKVTATPSGNTVVVKWNAPTDDSQVKEYVVRLKDKDGKAVRFDGGSGTSGNEIRISKTKSTTGLYTYTMTGLGKGDYFPEVSIVDLDGKELPSQKPKIPAKVTTSASPPAAPGGLSVTGHFFDKDNPNKQTVELSWTASDPGKKANGDPAALTAYTVYWAEGSSVDKTSSLKKTITPASAGTAPAKTLRVEGFTLDADKEYAFIVTASSDANLESVAGTAVKKPALNFSIQDLQASYDAAESTVTVSWTALSGNPALKGYKLYIKKDGATVSSANVKQGTGTITHPEILHTAGTYSIEVTVVRTDDTESQATEFAGTVSVTSSVFVSYKSDDALKNHGGKFSLGDFDDSRLFRAGGLTAHADSTIRQTVTVKEGSTVKHSGTAQSLIVDSQGNSDYFGISGMTYAAWAGIDDNANVTITIALTTVGGAQIASKTLTKKKTPDGDIHTWRDLQNMKHKLDGNYTLRNSISFPAKDTQGFKSFEPIAGKDTDSAAAGFQGAFTGSLDGGSKTITGLYINLGAAVDNTYVGLFGYIKATSADTEAVKDLTLADAKVVGYAGTTGTLKAFSSGTIAGELKTGKIINVTATSENEIIMNGYQDTGGLVGVNSGVVQGNVSGNVNGRNDNVGGLVGHNKGTVRGTVSGDTSGYGTVGGLVGMNEGTVQGSASGAVRSGGATGGLVGGSDSGIVIGVASGKVSGIQSKSGGLVGNGGTPGAAAPTVRGYWDKEATEQTASPGGGTGISKIADVTYKYGRYFDGDAEVFSDAEWHKYFRLPKESGKWPQLVMDSSEPPSAPALSDIDSSKVTTANGKNTIELSWAAPADSGKKAGGGVASITQYTVFWRVAGGSAGSQEVTSGGGAPPTTASIGNFDSKASPTFTVTATSDAGRESLHSGEKKLAVFSISYKSDAALSGFSDKFSLGDFDDTRLFKVAGLNDYASRTIKRKVSVKVGNEPKHAGGDPQALDIDAQGNSPYFGISGMRYDAWADITDNADVTITIELTTAGGEQIKTKTFTKKKTPDGSIHTWRDLQNMQHNLDGSYTLRNDISFPVKDTQGFGSFTPVGRIFTGTLDGGGKTVSGLYVSQPTGKSAGLFAGVGNGGEVKDLKLVDPEVRGAFRTGAFAGFLTENAVLRGVEASRSDGTAMVSGTQNVGGLVGQISYARGAIVIGSVTGKVSGTSYVGGLTGWNDLNSTVIGIASGSVSGFGKRVGALTGGGGPRSVRGYWDMEATGQTTSPGGGTGISRIADVAYRYGRYFDGETEVFNDAEWHKYFRLPQTDGTWPQLVMDSSEPPAAPVLNTIPDGTVTGDRKTIRLSWSAPAAGKKAGGGDASIAKYTVYWRTDESTPVRGRKDFNATAADISGLDAAKNYIFSVTATSDAARKSLHSTELRESVLIDFKTDAALKPHEEKFSLGDFDHPRLFKASWLNDYRGETIRQKVSVSEENTEKHAGAVTDLTVSANGTAYLGISGMTYAAWAGIADNANVTITVELTESDGAPIKAKTFTKKKTPDGSIYTWRDLQNMKHKLGGSYTVQNDFAFPDKDTQGFQGFDPVGAREAPFTGTLDGNGKTISKFYAAKTGADLNEVGIIGSMGSGGKIRNLKMLDPYVKGNDSVGVFVGTMTGTASLRRVEASRAEGVMVEGTGKYIGGLAGYVHTGAAGVIVGTASGEVKGGPRSAHVGGLVGYSGAGIAVVGTVSGKLSGGSGLGGLVGAYPPASSDVRGYWDKEATGETVSSGGGAAISRIADVTYRYGRYFDGETEVFNDTEWHKFFRLPGQSGTWPQLVMNSSIPPGSPTLHAVDPGDVTASGGKMTVELSWTAPADEGKKADGGDASITQYTVYWQTDSEGGGQGNQKIASSGTTLPTSTNIAGLDPTKLYRFTVRAKNDGNRESISSGKSRAVSGTKSVFITGFAFRATDNTGFIADSTALIDEAAKTISAAVFGGRGNLKPTITTHPAGASASPASGTARNFGGPVSYTVTARDATPKTYIVTVTEPSLFYKNDAALKSHSDKFSLGDFDNPRLLKAGGLTAYAGETIRQKVSVKEGNTVKHAGTVQELIIDAEGNSAYFGISGMSYAAWAGIADNANATLTIELTRADGSPIAGTALTKKKTPDGSIYTWRDLQGMKHKLAESYKVQNDFAFPKTGTEGFKSFEPVGSSAAPFAGVLDGQGKTISGLYIDNINRDNVGLFGVVKTATIKLLKLSKPEITGGENVGAFVGATGTVRGDADAGYRLTMLRVEAFDATVQGAGTVGGLVGLCYGHLAIEGGVVSGEVKGANVAGGFVGELYASGPLVMSGIFLGKLSRERINALFGKTAGGFRVISQPSYWDVSLAGTSRSGSGDDADFGISKIANVTYKYGRYFDGDTELFNEWYWLRFFRLPKESGKWPQLVMDSSEPPAAPTLNAVPAGTSAGGTKTVKLSWAAPTGTVTTTKGKTADGANASIDKYTVYWRTDENAPTTGRQDADSTTAEIPNLDSAKTYIFTVTATNDAGREGLHSAERKEGAG